MVKLSRGESRTAYCIAGTTAQGKALARLDSLGLVAGESVYVISSSYAGLIVDVKGSRLAICKSMADKLEVVEAAPAAAPAPAAVPAAPAAAPAAAAAAAE